MGIHPHDRHQHFTPGTALCRIIEQLQWLAEQGTEVWLEPGEIHRAQGDPADHVL